MNAKNSLFLEIYLKNKQNPIPLKRNSKEPEISWKEWQLKIYDGKFPENCNIGTICGKISNEFVLDFDFDELPEIVKEFVGQTLSVKSGKRGYHIHFRAKDGLPPSTKLVNDKGQTIDVLSEGKYAVSPPSIHPETGREYEIISPVTTIKEVNAAEIFEKLEKVGFSKPRPKNIVDKIFEGGIIQGSRHTAALQYVNHLLFKTSLDQQTIQHEMNRWNQTNTPPQIGRASCRERV